MAKFKYTKPIVFHADRPTFSVWYKGERIGSVTQRGPNGLWHANSKSGTGTQTIGTSKTRDDAAEILLDPLKGDKSFKDDKPTRQSYINWSKKK